MSLVAATATFRPSGDISRVGEAFVRVRAFLAVQRAQQVIVDEARSNAPVKTGELRASIHALEIVEEGQRVIGTVVADAPWAAFVEFGTGTVGSGTYPYELPQQGVPYTGSWIYDYKRQNWKGMQAQPYMRPALDTGRDRVYSQFKEAA
jgi:HK97 gp10 family phage protein